MGTEVSIDLNTQVDFSADEDVDFFSEDADSGAEVDVSFTEASFLWCQRRSCSEALLVISKLHPWAHG